MGDGLTDSANQAHYDAMQFVRQSMPGRQVFESADKLPPSGVVVLVYEEWLTHVVELAIDGIVRERWAIESFKAKPKRLDVTAFNRQPGYYRDHRLTRKH